MDGNAPTESQQLTIAGMHAHLRDRVAAALAEIGVSDVDVELAAPPKPDMGDFGYPCFALAKTLRKAPPAIAAELAAKLSPDELIAEVSSAGPYVNLTLDRAKLCNIVVSQALFDGERFGGAQADPPAHVMVEYSAPNTNKPLHLGHVRNNLLGAAMAKILGHYGHRVTRINLVNDRGVHICKSMLAYERWGDGTDPDKAGKKGDHLVGDFYVRFDQELEAEYAAWRDSEAGAARLAEWLATPKGQGVANAWEKAQSGDSSDADGDEDEGGADAASPSSKKKKKKKKRKAKPARPPAEVFFSTYKDDYFNNDSPLGAAVREMLRKWEAGDEETLALWRKLNGWVLAGFDQTYDRMGVGFEHTQFESDTYKLGKSLVQRGLDEGIFDKREDGSVICDLTKIGMTGEKVLLRADGTSLYMTQDLGTANERVDKLAAERLVYVVGDEQNYHFEVLFGILGLLRPGMTERCTHLSYGMIRLPDGSMKSRKGNVVDADDLMDEVHHLARAETEQRAAEGKAHTAGISDEELDHRAEHIGMAALKYMLLNYAPRTSFEYDPKKSISFLGQTGPYCLFNYARTRSLLRKAGGTPTLDTGVLRRLGTPEELETVRLLAVFPDVVRRAAETFDPSRISEHCFELCRSFAVIFTDKEGHPIATCEDRELRSARLLLAESVGQTLRTGLSLLGIDVLEEM